MPRGWMKKRSMREALAALALCLAAPAVAQTAPPPAAAVAPAPDFKARLDQLVALLNGGGDYDALFSPAFRQAVPQAQFQTYAGQLKTQGGTATGVESIDASTPWQATVAVGYQKIIATMLVAVDPAAPHQITGLRITTAEPRDDSLAKLEADFARLHGSAGFGIYALDDAGVTPIAEVKGETAAPLGSAFKLWMLAEAAREVAAGERHWDDVIRIGRRSLPSGILQGWPENAPVTLQTAATLMISISDNTAADTLLTTLGQDKVGAMVRTIGVTDPDRTLPVLTTMQAFELKTPAHAALADAWAKDAPEARAKLLADNAAAFDVTPIIRSCSPASRSASTASNGSPARATWRGRSTGCGSTATTPRARSCQSTTAPIPPPRACSPMSASRAAPSQG
jgi:beta-lactamase class A